MISRTAGGLINSHPRTGDKLTRCAGKEPKKDNSVQQGNTLLKPARFVAPSNIKLIATPSSVRIADMTAGAGGSAAELITMKLLPAM